MDYRTAANDLYIKTACEFGSMSTNTISTE
jgi:hypothetical protein